MAGRLGTNSDCRPQLTPTPVASLQCPKLVDACKEYLQGTMQAGSPNWLWAAACIAHALHFDELLADAIVALVCVDINNEDSASTPLASALSLLDSTSPEQQLGLIRKGVARACQLNSAPEVLVVVVIMRMDQLAAGRPLVAEDGKYLDTTAQMVNCNKRLQADDSGGKVKGSSKAGRGRRGRQGGASRGASAKKRKSSSSRGGSSSSSSEWPEVPDDLPVSLLDAVDWNGLEEAELLALINQIEKYPHETSAADFLRRRMLRCLSQNYLALPIKGCVPCQGAAWVNFPPEFAGPPSSMFAGSLSMMTVELLSKDIRADLQVWADEGGRVFPTFLLQGPAKYHVYPRGLQLCSRKSWLVRCSVGAAMSSCRLAAQCRLFPVPRLFMDSYLSACVTVA